jgi:kynureninase
MMTYINSKEFALECDQKDTLSKFRDEFYFPQHEGENCIYFTGNSLGLQPKKAKNAFEIELNDWAKHGVEGHFNATNPWFSYHERFTNQVAQLAGALPHEVVMMNTLTANLHLLMVSFYQPTAKRYKILCEAKAFPSDQYALESQVRFHNLDPEDAIIEISPREGEHTIRHEDILQAIQEHGDELALIMIGGVNYYTGQLFDMKSITEAGHQAGAIVGFDLAHAAGNVELKLHDWNVDFAAWCTYKYLNSGPGSVSGVYIHEKHAKNKNLKRFAGWWGHDKSVRFKMEKGFVPMESAESWQMSNAAVFNMVAHKVSLDLFFEAGLSNIYNKRDHLTGFLEFVINDISERNKSANFEVITPKDKTKRGAQLSILAHGYGKSLFEKISAQGVIADWREPNVIRIAPAPLYNSYMDVWKFGQILEKVSS